MSNPSPGPADTAPAPEPPGSSSRSVAAATPCFLLTVAEPPAENPDGYEHTSRVTRAKDLHGRLLFNKMLEFWKQRLEERCSRLDLPPARWYLIRLDCPLH